MSHFDVFFELPGLVAHLVLPAGWMATGCLAAWPDVSICAVRTLDGYFVLHGLMAYFVLHGLMAHFVLPAGELLPWKIIGWTLLWSRTVPTPG